MKALVRILLLSSLAASVTGVAFAQQTTPASKGVPGYLNPKTHIFTTRAHALLSPDATTAKVYTGTLKYEYTIKLVTPVVSGQALYCQATALVEDETGGQYYEESAAATAKASGSTATCTVNIPYSWSLSDESADTISIGYELTIAPTSTTNADVYFATREHTSELAPIKIPTSGATTPIVISATI